MAPDQLIQALLVTERVVLGQHRQLEEAQLVATSHNTAAIAPNSPMPGFPSWPLPGQKLDLAQREQ